MRQAAAGRAALALSGMPTYNHSLRVGSNDVGRRLSSLFSRARTSASAPADPLAAPPPGLVAAVGAFMQRVCRLDRVRAVESTMAEGCLETPPGQLQRCASQLHASRTWPADAAWANALSRFSTGRVLFVGDSALRNKYASLRASGVGEACTPGKTSGVCYLPTGNSACTDLASGNAATSHFDAVVYNFGNHYIHPRMANTTRSVSDFMAQIASCAKQLKERYPKAILVYKMTNALCAEKWDGKFAANAASMRLSEERKDYHLQWSGVGSHTLNVAEQTLYHEKLSDAGWKLLGTRTRLHCECSAMHDGRHFLPLIPDFLVRLSEIVWGDAPLPRGNYLTTALLPPPPSPPSRHTWSLASWLARHFGHSSAEPSRPSGDTFRLVNASARLALP